MAIDQGTETVAITTEERTWRITIDTPKGADPTVTIHRQTVRSTPDGSVLAVDNINNPIRRSLSTIAKEEITVDGVTLSGVQTAAFLSAWADMWRQQDIDRLEEERVKLLNGEK